MCDEEMGFQTAAGRLLVESCCHNTHDCLFCNYCSAGPSACTSLKAPLSCTSFCRKILFSCDPVALLFLSGHLYLDIGHFKEGSLENTKFG